MTRSAVFIILLLATAVVAATGQTEMTGPLTRDEILSGNPDWTAIVASYIPAPEAIDKLKTLDRPVEVEVFLGTWCPDSKRHVSEFFRVLDMADSPLLIATYVGVPKDKAARAPFYGGKDIQKLPTFVLTRNGQEIGRIIEIPAKTVEQDLVDILFR